MNLSDHCEYVLYKSSIVVLFFNFAYGHEAVWLVIPLSVTVLVGSGFLDRPLKKMYVNLVIFAKTVRCNLVTWLKNLTACSLEI